MSRRFKWTPSDGRYANLSVERFLLVADDRPFRRRRADTISVRADCLEQVDCGDSFVCARGRSLNGADPLICFGGRKLLDWST